MEQVRGLRDAADIIMACAELGVPLYVDDNTHLGTLARELAYPVAQNLRASAELIEATGHCLGLPVNYDLQIASLVTCRDLGHNR